MSYRISVIISTYNDRQWVPKKCAELVAQTAFRQAEFIFIETASPQRERTLLAPFCARYNNCRLITTEGRKTLYQAWNLGWQAATAPLLCYSNMDDAMHPRLLENVLRAMANRRWDACTVLIVKIPLANTRFNWSADTLRFLPLSLRPGPFTAWRADISERMGCFDERFTIAGDKDFWARMLAHRLRLGLIPKVLYCYCKSADQLSKRESSRPQQLRDQALAAVKPYPHRWSGRIRWQIFFLRYPFKWLFKFFIFSY